MAEPEPLPQFYLNAGQLPVKVSPVKHAFRALFRRHVPVYPVAADALRLGVVRPAHLIRHTMEPADHQPVFIETAEVVLIERAHDPSGTPLHIMHPVQLSRLSCSVKDPGPLPLIQSLNPFKQIQKLGKGMMIKALLTAVLIAAVAGKTIARGRPVVRYSHAAVQVPQLFKRSVEDIPVSSEEGREDAHALLQDRVEIMSQVSWSSSST